MTKESVTFLLEKGKVAGWQEHLIQAIRTVFFFGIGSDSNGMSISGDKDNATQARNAYKYLCPIISLVTAMQCKGREQTYQDKFAIGLVIFLREKILFELTEIPGRGDLKFQADILLRRLYHNAGDIANGTDEISAGYKAGDEVIKQIIKPRKKLSLIKLYQEIERVAKYNPVSPEPVQEKISAYKQELKAIQKHFANCLYSLKHHANDITTGNLSHHKMALIDASESIAIHIKEMNLVIDKFQEIKILDDLREFLVCIVEKGKTASSQPVKKAYNEVAEQLAEIILKSIK